LRDFAWFGVPESHKFFKGKSFPLQTNPHKKQNETPQGNEIEENDEPRDRNALGRDFVKMAQEKNCSVKYITFLFQKKKFLQKNVKKPFLPTQ